MDRADIGGRAGCTAKELKSECRGKQHGRGVFG